MVSYRIGAKNYQVSDQALQQINQMIKLDPIEHQRSCLDSTNQFLKSRDQTQFQVAQESFFSN